MNDLILLAALLEGPKHGWALKKVAGTVLGSGDMHNNLVYPLLKKFVAERWVRRRSEPGQRGQTRAVYCLTARGHAELLRRLEQFGDKEAASPEEIYLRVGLFALLDGQTRARILAARDRYLESREKRFAALGENLSRIKAEWGSEVVEFLLEEVRNERRWIRAVARKAAHAPVGEAERKSLC
jgi:DNA-binding PadR family transcriptional regulator